MIMCKSIFLLILFAVPFFSSCVRNEKKAELGLNPYIYDLGNIKENGLYHGSTIITNMGNDTLKIGHIQIGCGCTNVDISKLIIMPKDTALLSFTYNSRGKFGNQKENIIITANTDSLAYLFQFKAFVGIEDE